ncbi:hypothetical protein J2S70_000751 [Trueperella bonasi]|uniref:DUF6667 domain-containing protein n=1 Tax=Trueperella bonasi TaxID=312286 RepID=A0ABT9NFK0_9ACTO|nr:DUF6667 domain-containing protein [Trueperella bonasi]MDP9806169.1 hypothetical protein [Trueperella bonasi]
MGIEGAALAVGALLLLAYVAPQIARNRSVLADAPIGERYSADLRIITERTLQQDTGEHGKIFTTERTMSTPQGQREHRAPSAAKMRAAARDRSRARARIAQRAAAQQRALFGAAALVGVTVLLWILAGATSVPAGVAIASTALGGAYLLGLGVLVSNWSSLNEEDEGRISRANKVLRSRRDVRRQLTGHTKKDAPVSAGAAAHSESNVAKPVESADVRADSVTAAKELSKKTEHSGFEKPERVLPAPRVARVDRIVNGEELAEKSGREADLLEAPSYTLKPTIQRRTVKPYVAPETAEADVPYRPTRVGERIGDEPIEAANPAPGVTGTEELRSDVLGGGSTLDALLDRRRA